MNKPAIPAFSADFHTRGCAIDIFSCSYALVEAWGQPALRNPFWRCYLPITEGASVRSPEKVWPMRANEAMLIPADSPVCGHASVPFSLYFAHFSCSIGLVQTLPLTLPVDERIRQLLDTAAGRRDEALFAAATLQLVTAAIAAIPATKIRARRHDQRTATAYRIMNEKLGQKLSNAELAQQLNMSEASLLRLFRDAIGASPQKEHLRLRLTHAASLLQQTAKSIDHIAEECGFSDRNYFTRVFTREWKSSPARYRKSATRL